MLGSSSGKGFRLLYKRQEMYWALGGGRWLASQRDG